MIWCEVGSQFVTLAMIEAVGPANEDDRNLNFAKSQLMLQIEAAESRQPDVSYQTGGGVFDRSV